MNFVSDDNVNYDNNKHTYFELCESCFWCASYIDSAATDDENKTHMTTTSVPTVMISK